MAPMLALRRPATFLLSCRRPRTATPRRLDYKTLTGTSKETTGTAHPAILSLQKAAEGGEPLSVRQDSEKQWVIVHFVGKAKQGSAAKDLPVDLVVVGKAAE